MARNVYIDGDDRPRDRERLAVTGACKGFPAVDLYEAMTAAGPRSCELTEPKPRR